VEHLRLHEIELQEARVRTESEGGGGGGGGHVDLVVGDSHLEVKEITFAIL
jgi:hypothetical protein